jgi:ATP-binding cassette, subfamily C, bacterial CydCD
MRPLDPRLLRYASGARVPIGALAGTGLVTAGLTIVQAWLLATVIAGVFVDKATLSAALLVALAAVTAGRAVTAWAAQALAHHAAATARSQLRGALLARVVALGPGWRRAGGRDGGRDSGRAAGGIRDAAGLTQLATAGLDGLDGYFTSYLPALMLAVAVPLAVLAVIAVADPLSGVTVAVTLPLLPLFGALIGMVTGQQAERRLKALAGLAHHFQDVVSGLPTLRVFGRAGAQRGRIERVTGEYRRATMATLRLAFLSSLALELIATMSVALVATEIGLRLAYGHLDLRTGLLVLILAPEAYLPLRALGTHFHATADGLAAASEVFTILETPAPGAAPGAGAAAAPTAGSSVVPAAGSPAAAAPVASHPIGAVIGVDGVSVRHDGRAGLAPYAATFRVIPGRLTVLTGPSGCGKSTMLSVLLGFTEPSAGSIARGPVAASQVTASPRTANPASVGPLSRGQVARGPVAGGPVAGGTVTEGVGWLPQEPTLFAGTVADNIRLGRPDAPDEEVAAAARDAALDDVGLAQVLGERGAGLSSGQRRRVALARALLPGAPLLLLDEPTAGLDAGREAAVIATCRRLAAAGRSVVVVSHRSAVIAAADELVNIAAGDADGAAGSADGAAGGADSAADDVIDMAGGGAADCDADEAAGSRADKTAGGGASAAPPPAPAPAAVPHAPVTAGEPHAPVTAGARA